MGPVTDLRNTIFTGVVPVTISSFNPVIDTLLQYTHLLLLLLTTPTGMIIKILIVTSKKDSIFVNICLKSDMPVQLLRCDLHFIQK